jgi:murein DD-endopeptidase MepM/ murein hydrolase activator NlpD
MARQYARLMIIPEDGGKLRQVRVRLWSLYTLGATAILAAALLVGAGCIYLRLLRSEQCVEDLRTENESLRSELVTFGSELAQLDGLARNHIRLANDSRLLAGLPPISEEVALLGVGGTPEAGTGGQGRGLSAPLDRTAEFYREQLQQLSRQLEFQEESFVEVRQVIEASRDRLDRIPTVNPVLGPYHYSSGFGRRRDPFTGEAAFHPGIDICAARGTPFRATADGTVVLVERSSGLGLTVVIGHGNGYETLYGHCDKVTVSTGQTVRRGEVIGEVGSTGRSTGPHVHYEVHQNGQSINPRPFLLENQAYGS